MLLWLLYFALLMLVTEMMPVRLNRRFAAFLASKANAAFWWCFVQAPERCDSRADVAGGRQ